MERGRTASQWISHSRPGLPAGGYTRGEITGLLPRRSLHRHTATDRKLLAPGRLTDSPQHCFRTAIFSFTHVQRLGLTYICMYLLLVASAGLKYRTMSVNSNMDGKANCSLLCEYFRYPNYYSDLQHCKVDMQFVLMTFECEVTA